MIKIQDHLMREVDQASCAFAILDGVALLSLTISLLLLLLVATNIV